MANELLKKCNDAVRKGASFPTIWVNLLKGHPLVRGVPVQVFIGRLEIQLFNGQHLVYHTEEKSFELQ